MTTDRDSSTPERSNLDRNNLDGETSPYLLQHKDNPVHWQAWGPETLARAKALDRPILLSIGYAACHWCHVMAHESFENPEIAALMNRLFVNVKVDREERPDIDTIYQAALAMLGEHGGWPLTMFLTPDGEPFWGGTYFPSEPKFGRPGFPSVLERIAEVYRSDPQGIEKNRAALMNGLQRMAAPPELPADTRLPDLSPALLDRVAERLLEHMDMQDGGFGGAPKFPHTGVLELLWRAHLRTGRQDLADAVTLALDGMCQGGIYDHLGGGFARYSTDARWLVPHFEKMLYDNAQLVGLLTRVHCLTGDPLYRHRVEKSIDWLLREMVAEGGGFAASLDADSEGEEGRFYTWSAAEVEAVLGDDAALFAEHYDISPAGNWEGRNIPNRLATPGLGDPATEEKLAECRRRLFAYREQRVRPGWDDKVLADWNGMMIAALTEAAQAFRRSDWQDAAATAYRFVRDEMRDGQRLLHAARAGRARHTALLDDYAQICRAALMLHQASGESGYLDDVRTWLDILDSHYWDRDNGGYYLTADDAKGLITRTRNAQDGAIPSGNGTMVEVLYTHARLTGETARATQAEAILDAFMPELGRNVFALTTLLNAADLVMDPVDIAIIGTGRDSAALRHAAWSAPAANRILWTGGDTAALPAMHPAHGKPGGEGGTAVAYVCRDRTCSLPQTEPETLLSLLSPRHGGPEDAARDA